MISDRSLRSATTLKGLISLQRDNLTTGNFWICADELNVTLAQQKLGESCSQQITIPRVQFNKLVDFYHCQQSIPKRRSGSNSTSNLSRL